MWISNESQKDALSCWTSSDSSAKFLKNQDGCVENSDIAFKIPFCNCPEKKTI